MIASKSLGIGSAVFVLCATLPAAAGFVEIGGGWAAQWDNGLDPFVDVISNGVDGDAVFIRKVVTYNGDFQTVPIVFRQLEWPAVSNIVIEDEMITNATGSDWTGFTMQLLEAPDAIFDVEATMNSGGGGPIGFSIDPFTAASYADDDRRLDISGGIVPSGTDWLPGAGAGGQLWIAVNPREEEPFTIFTLKETPLPGPGAAALLAMAGLRRRRRR